MLSKFLDPKKTPAFKKMFGTDKNKDILIHFLNDAIEFENIFNIMKNSFFQTTLV
ncbi:MAG: PD-(D/E)XK nuclease family transposase [Chlamydia sp.]